MLHLKKLTSGLEIIQKKNCSVTDKLQIKAISFEQHTSCLLHYMKSWKVRTSCFFSPVISPCVQYMKYFLFICLAQYMQTLCAYLYECADLRWYTWSSTCSHLIWRQCCLTWFRGKVTTGTTDPSVTRWAYVSWSSWTPRICVAYIPTRVTKVRGRPNK